MPITEPAIPHRARMSTAAVSPRRSRLRCGPAGRSGTAAPSSGRCWPSSPSGRSGCSACMATTEWYGLILPFRAATAWLTARRRALAPSVHRQGRVYRAHPGKDSAAEMYRVSEAGVLHHGEAFRAACSALAVQHDPPVLRQALKSRAVEELVLGNQPRAGDGPDLVLIRLPDVHQESLVVILVEHRLQLGCRDRRSRGGILCVLRDRPAECLIVNQLRDRRVLTAYRALGIFPNCHRPVAHLQRVIDHQPADEGVAYPGDDLDRLIDLDGPDRGAQHAEYAALGTRRDHARRRRLGVKAAVARAVLRPEHAGLAVEAVDGSPDVRLAEQHARIVDQVPGGEVVGTVDDEVVLREDLHRVVGVQVLLMQDDVHVRIYFPDAVGS